MAGSEDILVFMEVAYPASWSRNVLGLEIQLHVHWLNCKLDFSAEDRSTFRTVSNYCI